MSKENIAEEQNRVNKYFKENFLTIIFICGITWTLIQMVIIPIKQLEWEVSNDMNNHFKTIQDNEIIATQERKEESNKIDNLTAQVIRLQAIMDTKK